MTYDAVLVLSFGGPEGPGDVLPFLQNVTQGRGVPPERLAEVAVHYERFGGVSPINAANRALVAALRAELDDHDLPLPIYWGNRNWHPFVEDTVQAMADDGVSRALVLVTSAYSSYPACRQYQDDLARAAAAVGEGAPVLDKLRHFFDHPGFIEPHVDAVRLAVGQLPPQGRPSSRLLFTAHSIPSAIAAQAGMGGAGYVGQLTEAAALIAAAAAPDLGWELAYQSRSGPPAVPWLGPDIGERLRELRSAGVTDVVVVPVGFVSDHLEVKWDLDVEAAAVAADVGLGFARTATPGSDPRFVAMVRELIEERLDSSAPRRALSTRGPSWDRCPPGCCPAPASTANGPGPDAGPRPR
jgi:protoporphyrin/coproporphyrin ferrochelatase